LTTTVKDYSISYDHCLYILYYRVQQLTCIYRCLHYIIVIIILFLMKLFMVDKLYSVARSDTFDCSRRYICGFFGTTHGFNGIKCQMKTRARFMIYQIVFHTRLETNKNFFNVTFRLPSCFIYQLIPNKSSDPDIIYIYIVATRMSKPRYTIHIQYYTEYTLTVVLNGRHELF